MANFTVRGKVPFPLDMLRYDACYPITGDDAANIGYSLERDKTHRNKDNTFDVKLASQMVNSPTVERWRSFLWSVIHD